jgi:hypothetical protein
MRLIFLYNKSNFPKLMFMFEPLLDRQAAALKIQQSFRAYARRKVLRLLMLELKSDQVEFDKFTKNMNPDFLKFYHSQTSKN